MDKLWRSKTSRKFKYFWRSYFAHLLNPFNRQIVITFLSIPICLALFDYLYGPERLDSEVFAILIGFLGFLGAFAGYALLGLIFSIFDAYKAEKSLGFWSGDTYFYNERVLLQTVVVDFENNSKPIPIKVNDSEPRALVNFHIDIENAKERVFAAIGFKDPQKYVDPPPYGRSLIDMGLILDKAQTVYLHTEIMKSTVPITIRIYMKSWKAQRHINAK